MTSRTIRSALLSLAALAALSCSKTQDTAPERRVFGDPPTIQSVDESFDPQAIISCDFTNIVSASLCEFGIIDVQPQTGTGFTVVFSGPNREVRTIVYSDTPSSEPGIFIEGTHGEFIFKVKVTDPNSVPGGQTNILLVSSSFVQPETNVETSLVLFDDGSSNQFSYPQNVIQGENCTVNPNGSCTCASAVYKVRSGDAPPGGDGIYTRKFAVTNQAASPFLNDCLMSTKYETPYYTPPQSTIQFKIEAVDRQGNLTAWPTKLTGTTANNTFACHGDSCGCCYLHWVSQLASQEECRGLPGLISPSSAPNGVCKDLL